MSVGGQTNLQFRRGNTVDHRRCHRGHSVFFLWCPQQNIHSHSLSQATPRHQHLQLTTPQANAFQPQIFGREFSIITPEFILHLSNNQQQSATMGFSTFFSHVRDRLRRPFLNGQDMGVAFALYFVYPAILWLLIEKFHGVCGPSVYARKVDAIHACHRIFM